MNILQFPKPEMAYGADYLIDEFIRVSLIEDRRIRLGEFNKLRKAIFNYAELRDRRKLN